VARHEKAAQLNAKDACHDFKLYENSVGFAVYGGIKIQADSSYRGILHFHKTAKRRSRFVLRMLLICAIINRELG
jgi:hypothetical protein